MRRRLADMAIVITGATAGIGRALAVQLSAAGARLTLAARRGDLLDAVNRSLGGRHQTVVTDVGRRDDCERLVAVAVARHGRIDTLVCNAGYGLAKPVVDTTADEVTALFRTNVFGTVDAIRAVVPVMRRQDERDRWRGQVVVVSSAVARRCLPFSAAYGATKAAQLSLAEGLRVELRPDRIAVTSVHPAGTATDFFDTAARLSGRPAEPAAGKQSAEAVAAAIVRAIRRPRPEVWPRRGTHLGTSLCTLFPGLADRALGNFRRPTTPPGTTP